MRDSNNRYSIVSLQTTLTLPLPPLAIDHDMFKIRALPVFPLKKEIHVATCSYLLIKDENDDNSYAIFVLEVFQTAI